jgi:hypothetical protein
MRVIIQEQKACQTIMIKGRLSFLYFPFLCLLQQIQRLDELLGSKDFEYSAHEGRLQDGRN